jgi:hypothetical protein
MQRKGTMHTLRRSSLIAGLLLAAAGSTFGQTVPANEPSTPKSASPVAPAATVPPARRVEAPTTGNPARDTLIRMQRTISINFTDTPMQDVMRFIAEVTGADMEVMWTDDQNSVGLDKEKTISLKADKTTGLDLLEKVLDKATTDSSGTGGNTWQMTENGTLQCGPKTRLNKFRRVEIYPVRDLLMDIPNYANAPEFDLQSVLQSSGQSGGGGGQSPFRDTGNQGPATTKDLTKRVTELQNILTELVEPEQWVDNGGDAATIRFFQNTFIVNAPDYVHRQLNGYPYWSQRATKVSMVKGHRYVTLGVDTALAGLSGIENQPVSAPGPK